MPRIHNPTTLRSRNRVTNKTRLKIKHGDIDFDPDDTPIPISNDTAGVDAEDANEHHLQAVLSAASQQHLGNNKKTTRGSAAEKANASVSVAYIPTPDSTGTVDNYEELYPPGKWTDPATYIRSSETVDDAIESGLTGNFTYYMDERDQEWLDKNNEEARGEGTSAQGAVSAAGTSTRSGSSLRSAKAKGKEPEVVQPLVVSENEFELVMGLFEKVTHEKTEFLHHGFEQGMPFPPFSDYQETFSAPLPPSIFTTFTVPPWVPTPSQLTRIARVIYPYWRERRTERGGHRIISVLNFDETDTQNESYICFRRREIKAVRKTRASQVTSSDKLLRLQSELLSSLELAKNVLNREMLKREVAHQSQNVWEKRLSLVDLKRRFPNLGAKEDEELLHDKERLPKRPRTDSASARLPGLRIKTHGGELGSPSHAEAAIRPKERTAMILSQIEREMLRQKDRDHQWDDQIDNLYQPTPVPYHQRLFKYISPSKAISPSSSYTDEEEEQPPRAIRLRRARGGRWFIDRRIPASRETLGTIDTSHIFSFRRRPHERDSDDDMHDEESAWRLAERWKFDQDDTPAVGPQGPDEQDRVLVDDYEPRFLRHSITLLHDQDQQSLVTDNSLTVTGPDGRMQSIIPYRLGLQPPMIRRDAQLGPRPMGVHPSQGGGVSMSLTMPNGTPISVQTQFKKMPPPVGIPQPQPRISSNGGMRPSTTPVVASMSSNPPPTQSSPPQMPPPPVLQPTNGVNGVNRSPSRASEGETVKLEAPSNPMTNGTPQNQPDTNPQVVDHRVSVPVRLPDSNSPVRPKSSQNQHLTVPMHNGYHVASMNGFPAMPNGSPYTHLPNGQHNGLSMQQMQNLKSVFANAQLQPGQDMNNMATNGGRSLPASYIGHSAANGNHFNMQLGAGANMNLKLQPSRQAQWSAIPSPLQHSTSLGNAVDSGTINGSMHGSLSPSPGISQTLPGQGLPMRTPSANGSRNGMRGVPNHIMGGQPGLGPMSMSPYLQHSPSPNSHAQLQPTPPRPSPTPPMTMVSPSLQHQQMVGGSQNGY